MLLQVKKAELWKKADPVKKKKWQAPPEEEGQQATTAEEEQQVHESEADEAPAPDDEAPLTLEQAKAIINDAHQPRTAGHENDPRPALDLLERAKAVVNADHWHIAPPE